MKQYLKDMEIEKQVDILFNNEDIRNVLAERYYEDLMWQQEEEGKLMFGEHWSKYIDIHDNYNSFFLRLKNRNEFLDNLDKNYLSQEGIDLYDETYNLYEEYNNICQYDEEQEDRFNELDELLDTKCEELLQICENMLHGYENYTDEDLKEFINNEIEFNHYGTELYILGDDTSKVYEDVSYTRTYC